MLHVWNTAGVASVIAKFTDREFGTESTVITRLAADRVGLTTYGKAFDEGAMAFFLRSLRMARGADVVHVHSLDRIVPWVKRLLGKPTVMHYPGTDIEGRWAEKNARWRRADYLAVSTPNLLAGAPSHAVYVPNPVDTDLFKPIGTPPPPDSALSFRYGMDAEAEAAAAKLGLKLAWLERWEVSHVRMPEVLAKHAYYIDMRKPPGRAVAQSVGRAALEALACGLRVVRWDGEVVSGLPPEHGPESVAARWNEVYSGLVRS